MCSLLNNKLKKISYKSPVSVTIIRIITMASSWAEVESLISEPWSAWPLDGRARSAGWLCKTRSLTGQLERSGKTLNFEIYLLESERLV